MALFESFDRRIGQIQPVMDKYGIKDFEDARNICKEKGFDPYEIVKGVQPICFENACWAYTLGAAIAIKSGRTKAADAAKAIGEGLQAFCIPGSVADDRKVGLGSKWDFPLEMVRLAPSAVNKQPWRVVVDGNMVHFFEVHSLPAAEVDLQRVDVGIAICHFHLAVLEQGMAGHFERIEPNVARGNNIDYIVSWIGA